MLNLFPIQFLSLFAYFILRVAVGLIFFILGYHHLKRRGELTKSFKFPFLPTGKYGVALFISLEFTIGILMLLGLYTQLAALLLIFLSLLMVLSKQPTPTELPSIPTKLTYFLFFFIGLTLFITGAGVFAFDLPI